MKLNIKGVIVPNDLAAVYDWLDIENVSPKNVADIIDNANGEPIDVEINSGGGYITAGNEIYSALKNYPGEVNIRVIWAASAASVIAMARYCIMEPTAMMMIHNVSGSAEGDYRDMAHQSEVLKTASKAMSAAYQLKSGKSEAEIMALMDAETWFTAKEALEMGFVDEVSEEQTMVASYKSPVLPQQLVGKVLDDIQNYNAALERFKQLGGE